MELFFLNLLDSSNIAWLIIGALGVGALTSLAPCSLLSVPLLVGSAVSLSKNVENKRKFTLIFSSVFALGVIVSFSILAFLVAKLGMFFAVTSFWPYFIAALLALIFALYSLGFFGSMDKSKLFEKLIKLELFGIFLIGIVFGLISTPCASAPLVTIISLATSLGDLKAYLLLLAFAIGHSILLFIAGISLSFTQKITSNKNIVILSSISTKFFALVLIIISLYLFNEGLLRL